MHVTSLQPVLRQAILHNKIGHAWLITGPKEKREQQSLLFAQALLCQNLQIGEACGICASCQKVKNGQHGDMQIIDPLGQSVKIEQLRNMQQTANLCSFEGGRQIIIINQADIMTEQAANSLLKILEDPPHGLYFILNAATESQLLTTILSRCQKLRLGEEKIEEISKNTEYKELAQRAALLLADLPNMSYDQVLIFAAAFSGGKESRLLTMVFLNELLTYLRDAAIVSLVPQAQLLCQVPVKDCCLSFANALKAAEAVEECQRLLKQNVNQKMLLDGLFLQLKEWAG